MDITYPLVIAAAKTWFRVADYDIRMENTEVIPRTGGAVLAVNHNSHLDFVIAGYPGVEQKRLTRFMAKREVFDHPIGGPAMRSFGHISVDRSSGAASLRAAADACRAGELVGIYPEATISRSFEIKQLKSGAARIAAMAGVPLIPITHFGAHRIQTKDHGRDFSRHKTILIKCGEPMHPTGEDPAAETAELHERMTALLDACITEYPEEEKPPGAWWVPASYGGSAPTLEQAERLDVAEKAERARRKAAKSGDK
ncbi:1-acyl-sn-glycerol-3-phosphate acyltransferase [Nocardioides panacisoli]|uniref:lysophospholipid acyltransferase family protein n=1 Tax=Nocardioides panacisoli TaxID=627624 RepID=UPI001C63358D|nr:lysophospholipid acyltransferase family protein [Nocardioides panacisoli]QYJ03289.1 1-acyl-sn-glycerol-3-phosphate acyltransferase [Nocardioides panacisoli]